MGKEQQPGGLKEKIGKSARDLLRSASQLAKGVEEAIDKGNFDPAEVAAALHLVEGISRTIREGVESGKEHVIFSRDQISENHWIQDQDRQPEVALGSQSVSLLPQGKEEVLTENKKALEEQEKPKNFSQLLTQKLCMALPEQLQFTREELTSFTGGIELSAKILESEEGRTFSRERTITILQKILTTPGRKLKYRGEFDKKRLTNSFFQGQRDVLDGYTSEIEHDWSETPKVSFEDAMQIRGLGMLQKLNLPPKT